MGHITLISFSMSHPVLALLDMNSSALINSLLDSVFSLFHGIHCQRTQEGFMCHFSFLENQKIVLVRQLLDFACLIFF